MIHQTIIIVDFGGQYAQLVARRVREEKVYCEVVPYNKAVNAIKSKTPVGVMFAGGKSSINEENAALIDKTVYEHGIPIMGVGYGAHVIAKSFGAQIEKKNEKASCEIVLATVDGFMADVGTGKAFVEHMDQISTIPEGFSVAAKAENFPFAAIENLTKKIFALQFQPEIDETKFGKQIIHNFLYKICGCNGDWTTANYVENAIAEIKKTVGKKRVLCAFSGGVDSTVCAVLVHKAIGKQLTCVFVDHGMMRKNEGDEVMGELKKTFELDIIRVNAGERFLGKLAGVTDPETKRKIIGKEFIEVFTGEAAKLGAMNFLLQGTIYPDVIESGLGDGAVIKSHHNVGGLPEKLGFELLEPVRQLFKDEVRAVGRELGIPSELVDRQPFPGPGLGVRCLGEITEDKLFILRESDAILREEIAKAGLSKKIWQYFTVLPNIKSVGVKGDKRTYSHTIGIRAVHSVDAMTSDWVRIPYDVLEDISSRIVNEVDNVNRIVYDCTTKPPSTIEWE